MKRGIYMDKLIEHLLKRELDYIIDENKEKLILSDEVYKKDTKDENELENKYLALDLSKQQRMIINDYIACIRTTKDRCIDLAYIAGIQDAIKLLNSLNLLKKDKLKLD